MNRPGMRLDDVLAGDGASIRECLAIIDTDDVGTVFVADPRRAVVRRRGEREIRRALVAGAITLDGVPMPRPRAWPG